MGNDGGAANPFTSVAIGLLGLSVLGLHLIRLFNYLTRKRTWGAG